MARGSSPTSSRKSVPLFATPKYPSRSSSAPVKEPFLCPNNSESIGLNPFTFEDPVKIAIIISSVLKEMYIAAGRDIEESFKQNVSLQAVENIFLLWYNIFKR